jgi:hypothetical protein
MNKDDLLKLIAETGYNVGIGAKKHFATYDLVDKSPGFIGFVSTAVGIFSLFIDALTDNYLSATFIVLGVSGLYISFYDHCKMEYESAGKEITKIFNELKHLYFKTKSCTGGELPELESELHDLENRFNQSSISKQILFSDWYAHYKFFWQHQIDWIEEQKQFRFFRDKIPFSLSLPFLIISLISVGVFLYKHLPICLRGI